ncbi:MAG: RNA methyltransferase [Acidobacteria bacterium]|nr:RNA methyltransferase [Acidobacteriota bacterium]
MQLTSKANPRFRALREEVRPSGPKRRTTLLLGTKLIEAWASSGPGRERLRPIRWLRLEGARPHPLEKALALDCWELGEALMRELGEAGSPPPHALVAELGPEPQGPLAHRTVGAWGVQDPGNLGAILRAAAAFGFQEALLGPGCADPFSPRALRGSMGAAFLIPVRRCAELPLDGARWYALDGAPGALPLAQADLSAPLRLLVGNEGHGWAQLEVPEAVQRLAIPVQGVESLNAAVAAGIACYEAARRGGW